MEYYSSQISKLIEELSKLPGIGAKTAGRLAFHIVNMPKEQVGALASAITQAKEKVRYCRECYTLTDSELCPICASEKRNHSIIIFTNNFIYITIYLFLRHYKCYKISNINIIMNSIVINYFTS